MVILLFLLRISLLEIRNSEIIKTLRADFAVVLRSCRLCCFGSIQEERQSGSALCHRAALYLIAMLVYRKASVLCVLSGVGLDRSDAGRCGFLMPLKPECLYIWCILLNHFGYHVTT